MSLSQPQLKNPCKKFIEFKGDTGVFRYYDKESKKNIELKYPIQFIVLDELSTIKGYCEQVDSGIYSNEVKSIKNQILNVKTFKGNLSVSGKYAEIKDKIAMMKGKYCKSVYAALINGKELELVNFSMMGASLHPWIDKECDVSLVSIKVEDNCTEGKKGKVVYKIPSFKGEAVSKELMDKAVEMDKALQIFLKSYSEKTIDESVQPDANEHEPAQDDVGEEASF